MANLTFFVLTTMKIIQIKNQTSVLKSKESSTQDQHRNDKQRLLLYVKLFVVMGFSWILEVISALYPKAEVFWRFTDAFNLLIGLFVFVIFVCKKNIFKLIKKRIIERWKRSTSDTSNDSMKISMKFIKRRWINEPQQRATMDTVRTILSLDTSINNNRMKSRPLH